MADALTRIEKHVARWEEKAAELDEKAQKTEYAPERAQRYVQVDTLRSCAKDIRRVLERFREEALG